MNTESNTNISPRRSPKLTRAEIEAMLRRRAEHFRVLAAISDLLPRSVDTGGHATGTLSGIALAAQAGVSRKATARALEHWRRWRVLWLFWKGDRVWDVRFERAVVERLLLAANNSSREVSQILIEHKRRREAVAPRRVHKTPSKEFLQTAEPIESIQRD